MHFSNVLVTTDLSDASFASLDLAAYESKMEGSKVTLLTVVSDWDVPISLYPYIPGPDRIEEYRKLVVQQATEKLNNFKTKLHNQPVNLEVIVSDKAAAEEVCSFAEKQGCDLIIMSSHGRGAFGDLFLGGTVQKVLRMSKVPVLVVPAKK